MELRLVLTVDDFDTALGFYGDALGVAGLEQRGRRRRSGLPAGRRRLSRRRFRPRETSGDARNALLEAGRATIELVNEERAAAVDEVEVALAGRLVAAGAEQVALFTVQ